VSSGQRIAQTVRPDLDRGRPANCRTAPLELVDREVDASPEEGPQARLDPILPHRPLEVAVFAAGKSEELPIGIRCVAVDCIANHGEKGRLSTGESPAEDRPGDREVERMAQGARQAANESNANRDVV
jgi:hypothetical protein